MDDTGVAATAGAEEEERWGGRGTVCPLVDVTVAVDKDVWTVTTAPENTFSTPENAKARCPIRVTPGTRVMVTTPGGEEAELLRIAEVGSLLTSADRGALLDFVETGLKVQAPFDPVSRRADGACAGAPIFGGRAFCWGLKQNKKEGCGTRFSSLGFYVPRPGVRRRDEERMTGAGRRMADILWKVFRHLHPEAAEEWGKVGEESGLTGRVSPGNPLGSFFGSKGYVRNVHFDNNFALTIGLWYMSGEGRRSEGVTPVYRGDTLIFPDVGVRCSTPTSDDDVVAIVWNARVRHGTPSYSDPRTEAGRMSVAATPQMRVLHAARKDKRRKK